MVGINVPIPVPVSYYSFGGWKASLFGDTHMYGPEGINFYTRGKVVTTRWPDPATSRRSTSASRRTGDDGSMSQPRALQRSSGSCPATERRSPESADADAGDRGHGPRRRAADDAAVGARRRPRQAGRDATGSRTCGRSTRHILWEEPYVIYSQILAETRNVDRRADGHQPGDPRLDRHGQHSTPRSTRCTATARSAASAAATRRCASPTASRPRSPTLRRVDPRDPRARQRPQRRVQGLDAHASRGPTAAALEVWVAGYGPEGADARPARSATASSSSSPTPQIAAWTIDAVRDAAAARRPRPRRDHDLRRRAGLRRRRPRPPARPVPLVRRDGRQPRRRHRRPLRRRRRAVPAALTDYIKGRAGLRLQRARPGRQHPHRRSCPTRSSTASASSARSSEHIRRLDELRDLGVDQFAVYLQHDGKDDTLAGLRRARHPGAHRAALAKRDDPIPDASDLTTARRCARSCCSSLALVARGRGCGSCYKSLGPENGGEVLGWRDPAADQRHARCRTCGTWSQRLFDPESRDVGHADLAVVLAGAWYSFRLALVRVRRSAPPSASALAVLMARFGVRRARAAAVPRRVADGAADRPRPARRELGRQAAPRSGGTWPRWLSVVGARRVPRVLPGRGRHAARPRVGAGRRRSS